MIHQGFFSLIGSNRVEELDTGTWAGWLGLVSTALVKG